MSSLSVGDLAQSFVLRNQNISLKDKMNTLTQELATGQTLDVSSILANNFSYLSDIENGLRVAGAYSVANAEATQYTEILQSVMENVQNLAGSLSTNLLSAASGGIESLSVQSASEARAQLDSIIGAMNTTIGGRSLLSGTATGTRPMASTDDLLSALGAELTGVVGSAAKIAAAEAWFDDPAGFDAVVYQGSSDALAPFRLSESENLELDVRANNTALKDMLQHIALAALSDDAALVTSGQERQELLFSSGEGLLSNQEALVSLRASVGSTQARIDEIGTRSAAQRLSLEFARASLLAADPYETATRLEEVQFQLQSLYTLTVKSSQLSLVNFL